MYYPHTLVDFPGHTSFVMVPIFVVKALLYILLQQFQQLYNIIQSASASESKKYAGLAASSGEEYMYK